MYNINLHQFHLFCSFHLHIRYDFSNFLLFSLAHSHDFSNFSLFSPALSSQFCKTFFKMTITLSVSVKLINKPQLADSRHYKRTTARAISLTKEGAELEFELKFFYDTELAENTVPERYSQNQILHFTVGFVTSI